MLSPPPGLGCTYGVGSLHGALLRHAAKAEIMVVGFMRAASIFMVLMVLAGCPQSPCKENVRAGLANSRGVTIYLLPDSSIMQSCRSYHSNSRLRNYDMQTRAQRECDRDGKYAVLDREELGYDGIYIHYYRCSRKPDQYIIH